MKQKYNFHCRKVHILYFFHFMVSLLQIISSSCSKELLADGVITPLGWLNLTSIMLAHEPESILLDSNGNGKDHTWTGKSQRENWPVEAQAYLPLPLLAIQEGIASCTMCLAARKPCSGINSDLLQHERAQEGGFCLPTPHAYTEFFQCDYRLLSAAEN